MLAGTDNDYSVTQNGTGTQFDLYFRFQDADPYAASIQCPAGQTADCFLSADNATAATLTADYQLLPGVLHAYTATVDAYVGAVPVPRAWLLIMGGLFAVDAAVKQRR